MSMPLFKVLLKKNWKMWAIYTGVLAFYLATIILTFEGISEAMEDEDMAEFLAALGMDLSMWSNAMEYTADMFFGQLVFIFPMVFYIMLCNKMIIKPIDDTSISSHLSASISRKKYVLTTGIFLMTTIIAMFAVVLILGSLCLSIYEEFIFINYLNLCVYCMLCTLAIAFIGFFCSFVFAGSKRGFFLLIAVPIALYLLVMFSSLDESLVFLKYLTPFGWGDIMGIAKGEYNLWWVFNLIYIAIVSVLFFVTVKLFKRKQLSV